MSLVLMLSFIVCAFMFAACNSSSDNSTTANTTTAETGATTESTTVQTEATTTIVTPPVIGYDKPDGYLDIDFGGEEFVFATSTDPGWEAHDEIWVESREGGTIVNTAVYDRNAIMSKLYNCTIKAVPGSAALIAADIVSNTSDYDFATVQYACYSSNASRNYANIFGMNLNFDLPGWNMAYIDQCSTVDNDGVKRMYGFDGDFGLTGIGAIWIMAVNLDLFETNFADENIFDLVEKHEWTIDKLMEFCAAIAQDNGDQIWNVGDDVFGLVSTTHNTTGLLTGAGVNFVSKDSSGRLYCDKTATVLSGNAEQAINKLIDLYRVDGVTNEAPYTIVASTLGQGKALFIGQVFNVIWDNTDSESGRYGLANFDANYSPLPEPLYAAGDEYRSYVNNKFSSYYVSKNACQGDMEMASAFLNLFAYHSHYIVRPAVLTMMGEICCNDKRASDMVDIIMDSRIYDYAYYSGFFYGPLHTDIINGVNNLSQMANKNSKKVQDQINAYHISMTGDDR